MATLYVENPHNFSDIDGVVLTEKSEVLKEILTAERLYFYDTCAFRKHSHMNNPQWVFELIKKNSGVVVITRCILMELASKSGRLISDYVEYIKKMSRFGLKILIIYEEDLFDVLSACFSANEVMNQYLSFAVRTVKGPTSTITTVLKGNPVLLKDVILNPPSEASVYRRFFQEVRANKESEDNLGEEMIALCVHLLSNLPDTTEYKYLIFTEDKGAIGLFHKTLKNVHDHKEVWAFSALTTTKLAQCLYEERIITEKEQVEEVLSVDNKENEVVVLGSERYDLERKEKKLTCSELAEKIMLPEAIHIYY